MNTNIKLFKSWDWIIILILVMITGICFFCFNSSKKGQRAIITKDGVKIYDIEMSKIKEPLELKLNDEYNVVVKIETDGASVIYSDCPDKLCIKTGKISKVNQAAICLPARVAVKIEGIDGSIDAVTG